MTRHKHADLIIAKAENMELVVFVKGCIHGDWQEAYKNGRHPSWWNDSQYFLCLPQHKEACLHWLNGGEVQIQTNERWFDIDVHAGDVRWSMFSLFMGGSAQLRIKPRKEKRWIAVDPSCKRPSTKLFKSKSDLKSYLGLVDADMYGYQIVELEVEV